MAKDPAFLFYPGDWLGGTMGMTFEEKGAYLELLVMQWNCHRIAKEVAIRVVGSALWQKISAKFSQDEKGFFNKRLEEEIQKRRKHSEKQSDNAKKRWDKPKYHGNATAMPLENENENINEDVNTNEIENFLVPEMQKIFKQHNPTYKENRERDYKPLLSIAEFLIGQGKLEGTPAQNKANIMQAWDPLCKVISKDKFYCTKTLSTISKQIQEITQIALHGKSNGKPDYGSKERAKEYDRMFAERYGSGGSATS